MNLDSIPKLGRGCRLTQDNLQAWILLIPEGVLRLSGPGPQILQRCNGLSTLGQIIEDLERSFPGVGAGQIATETIEFLEKLAERRIVIE